MTIHQNKQLVVVHPKFSQFKATHKISGKTPSRFEELHQFCAEMGQNLHHPLHAHHQNAKTYRSIFWGIGLLFLSLMCFMLWQHPNLMLYGFYQPHFLLTKATLTSVAGSLSFLAFLIGWYIRAEREAVSHTLSQAKRRLFQAYSRRRIRLGIHRFVIFCDNYLHASSLRYSYHSALSQLHEAKNGTLALIQQIRSSKQLDAPDRTRLLNLAILELREKLDGIINSFRAANI